MVFTYSANAAEIKFEIDNDSNTYDNWSSPSGAWTKLSTGNHGDSRIHYGGGDSSHVYGWIINPGSYSGTLDMFVYLNDSRFNNPAAVYYAKQQAK